MPNVHKERCYNKYISLLTNFNNLDSVNSSYYITELMGTSNCDEYIDFVKIRKEFKNSLNFIGNNNSIVDSDKIETKHGNVENTLYNRIYHSTLDENDKQVSLITTLCFKDLIDKSIYKELPVKTKLWYNMRTLF